MPMGKRKQCGGRLKLKVVGKASTCIPGEGRSKSVREIRRARRHRTRENRRNPFSLSTLNPNAAG